MAVKICPSCSEENLESAFTCYKCGVSLHASKTEGVKDSEKFEQQQTETIELYRTGGSSYCASCGEKLEKDAVQCKYCRTVVTRVVHKFSTKGNYRYAGSYPYVGDMPGLGMRLVATLLDILILGVPLVIISFILTDGGRGEEYLTDFTSFLYHLLLPVVWQGYTIGKKICSIQIRKKDGSPPGIGTMLMRVLVASIVYGLTLGIGILVSMVMVAVREDRRAIHDFIAGTYVAYDYSSTDPI